MKRLLAELRRRKVFRVAVAYIVLGWVLIQVADTIAPMLGLPEAAPRFVLFLLIVMFPLAVFMAWAYELRPTDGEAISEESAGRSVLGVAIGIVLAAAIGLYLLWGLPETRELPETPARPPAAASIAVLPFADLSPEGDQEYFGDGIAEELLNVLAGVRELAVASRTSSFAFKGASRNVPEIARILDVAYVLEGSVRKADNRVRITAQLIDAATDRHLWSDVFERELTTDNLFSIQEEIARAIVTALDDELGIGGEASVSVEVATANLDAYELFLRAQKTGQIASLENMRAAIDLLQGAVDLDPQFVQARAHLARRLAWLPTWDHSLDIREASARAIAVARDALALDPGNLAAYDALETAYFNRHEWEAYESVVREAQAIAPRALRDPEELLGLGYLERANEITTRLIAQAPAENFWFVLQGVYHQSMGRPQAAIESFEAAILKGYKGGAELNLALAYVALGDNAVVSAVLTREYAALDPQLLPLLPHIVNLIAAVAGPGFPEAASRFRIVARELGFEEADLLRRGPRWGLRVPLEVAMAYDRYDAITELYWGNAPMFWMWAPNLQRWRRSDAFRERVRESGMLAYWRKYGWPDLCRPAAGEEFVCD